MAACEKVGSFILPTVLPANREPLKKLLNEFCTFLRNGLYYQSIGNATGALVSYNNAEIYLHIFDEMNAFEKNPDNNAKKESLEQRLLGYIEVLTEKTKQLNKSSGGPNKDDEESDWKDICSKISDAKSGEITYSDVIGLAKEKKEVDASFIKPLLYPNIFPALAKGILLYGPPGTGKTYLVKGMISELSSNEGVGVIFYTPTGAELKGKYVGETEKNIRNYFTCAGRAACTAMEMSVKAGKPKKYISIIFIDEFDTIGGDRLADPSGLMANSVNTVLQYMDGVPSLKNVSVVAATNYPWRLDAAILRRFNSQIKVAIPKFADIVDLIKFTYKKNIAIKNFNAWCYCDNKIGKDIYKPITNIGAFCSSDISEKNIRYHETPKGLAKKIVIDLPSYVKFGFFIKPIGSEPERFSSTVVFEPEGLKTRVWVNIMGDGDLYKFEFLVDAAVDNYTFYSNHKALLKKKEEERDRNTEKVSKIKARRSLPEKDIQIMEDRLRELKDEIFLIKANSIHDSDPSDVDDSTSAAPDSAAAAAAAAPAAGGNFTRKIKKTSKSITYRNKHQSGGGKKDAEKVYSLILFLAKGEAKPDLNKKLVDVVNSTISISKMQNRAPYNFFNLDLLQSPVVEEVAQIMYEKSYSNSDIDNLMTAVSKQAGRQVIESGSFIKWTFDSTKDSVDSFKDKVEFVILTEGSDSEREKYRNLKELEKYYISSFSKIKNPVIYKNLIENVFTNVDSTANGNESDFLNKAFYIPNIKKYILSKIVFEGKTFYNSRLLPGFSIVSVLSDPEIDEVFLEESYVRKLADVKNEASTAEKAKREGLLLRIQTSQSAIDMLERERPSGWERTKKEFAAELKKDQAELVQLQTARKFLGGNYNEIHSGGAATALTVLTVIATYTAYIAAAATLVGVVKSLYSVASRETINIVVGKKLTFTNKTDPTNDTHITNDVKYFIDKLYESFSELNDKKKREFSQEHVDTFIEKYGGLDPLFINTIDPLKEDTYNLYLRKFNVLNVMAPAAPIYKSGDKIYYFTMSKNRAKRTTGGPSSVLLSIVFNILEITFTLKLSTAQEGSFKKLEAYCYLHYLKTLDQSVKKQAKQYDDFKRYVTATFTDDIDSEDTYLLWHLMQFINTFFNDGENIGKYHDIFKQEKMVLFKSEINMNDPYYKELVRANFWHLRDIANGVGSVLYETWNLLTSSKRYIVDMYTRNFSSKYRWAKDDAQKVASEVEDKVLNIVENSKLSSIDYLIARADTFGILNINTSNDYLTDDAPSSDFKSVTISTQADFFANRMPFSFSLGRTKNWFVRYIGFHNLWRSLVVDTVWKQDQDALPALRVMRAILSRKIFAVNTLKPDTDTSETLNLLLDYARDNKDNIADIGSLDKTNFISSESTNKASFIKYKIPADIETDTLLNFAVNPSLLRPALKTFPSTYNTTLGKALDDYEKDREHFLSKRDEWPENKVKK